MLEGLDGWTIGLGVTTLAGLVGTLSFGTAWRQGQADGDQQEADLRTVRSQLAAETASRALHAAETVEARETAGRLQSELRLAVDGLRHTEVAAR